MDFMRVRYPDGRGWMYYGRGWIYTVLYFVNTGSVTVVTDNNSKTFNQVNDTVIIDAISLTTGLV